MNLEKYIQRVASETSEILATRVLSSVSLEFLNIGFDALFYATIQLLWILKSRCTLYDNWKRTAPEPWVSLGSLNDYCSACADLRDLDYRNELKSFICHYNMAFIPR